MSLVNFIPSNVRKPFSAFNTNSLMHWLYSNQLCGESSAYNEMLKKKDSIQDQLGTWPYETNDE